MYFPATTLCLSSLMLATVSASATASFELPSSVSSELPGVDTTTVYETSTLYLTSAITLTSAPAYSAPPEAPTNSSAFSESCTFTPPLPADFTLPASVSAPSPSPETISLCTSGNQTLTPTTLWEGSTTRVVYPQNSTAVIPTGYPAPPEPVPTESFSSTPLNGTLPLTSTKGGNGTTAVGTSTILITTSVSKTASTTKDESSATASVSEVPTNGAGKGVGNAMLGMGVVAGVMALL